MPVGGKRGRQRAPRELARRIVALDRSVFFCSRARGVESCARARGRVIRARTHRRRSACRRSRTASSPSAPVSARARRGRSAGVSEDQIGIVRRKIAQLCAREERERGGEDGAVAASSETSGGVRITRARVPRDCPSPWSHPRSPGRCSTPPWPRNGRAGPNPKTVGRAASREPRSVPRVPDRAKAPEPALSRAAGDARRKRRSTTNARSRGLAPTDSARADTGGGSTNRALEETKRELRQRRTGPEMSQCASSARD